MSINEDTLLQDTISRSRIVSETDCNFFVEAGAGSGKTTMLVNRMVAMVEQGKDISKICAITFTKNAAGEFYDRFQKLLAERSNPAFIYESKGHAGELPAPTDITRARCAYALQHIDLCFMGTIDSFCNMILSEHPTEAGIPSDATLMSDKDAQNIYRQEFVKICDGTYGEELKAMARTFRGLHKNPEVVFVCTMALIMDRRNAHFHFTEADCDIDRQYGAVRKELIQAVNQLQKHPEAKYEGNAPSRKAWDNLANTANAIRSRWSGNYARVNAALKSLKDLRLCIPCEDIGLSKGSVFNDHTTGKKNNYKWTEIVIGEEGGLIEKFGSLQYNLTMSFIMHCMPVLEKVMLEKGAMTYFDYLYYLRNMLAKDAAGDGHLIRYIYNRHSYFLIDEFQDTNPLQSEIFFYLTAEEPQAKWQECKPKDGSLFIVGDPKQSIYRFRNADVSSFLRVKNLFEANGGDILSLSRNFRSTKELCSYFNLQFSALLPKEDQENQSSYKAIPLPDQDKDQIFEGEYSYDAVVTGKGIGMYPEQSEEKVVTEIIKRLVGNPAHKIKGKEDKEPREIRYSDFMLISSTKKKLTGFMEEFKLNGIPTRVEGKVPFETTEGLWAIYQIYSSVADPGDRMALYSALNGIILGFTKEEILLYKKAGYQLSLKGSPEAEDNSLIFSADEKATVDQVKHAMETLRELSAKARRLSPAALYTEIMDRFEIFRIVDTDNMEVIWYTLELLRANEKSSLIVSNKDASLYLQKLLAGQADEERVLSLREQTDAVHLANLHKVKGLEAPIVILVHAGKGSGQGTGFRIEHTEEGTEGYLFGVSGENNISLFSTKEFKAQQEDEKDALACENDRLIYVAATRARNALIICKGMKASEDGDISQVNSKWDPLMSEIMKDIFVFTEENVKVQDGDAEVITADELYKEAEAKSVLADRRTEECTYEVKKPSNDKVISKIVDSDEAEAGISDEAADGSIDDIKQLSILHRFPTLLGTMTHRTMEMLVSAKNQIDADGMVEEIIKEYSTPQVQPYAKELKEALLQVVSTMRAGGYRQENSAPADILAELIGASETYCEVPFCYKDETGDTPIIWNGVMDVIYRNASGWHIIDYKTNADGGNLDKKYEGQMKAYEAAFYAMTGEKAKALTYHINI